MSNSTYRAGHAYQITGDRNAVLTDYDKTKDQYSEGYRYVWCLQFGPSYVLKDKIGAPWGSGVYELKSDNTLSDCVDWNYDSSD